MIDRRSASWLAGLAALALSAGVLALLVNWWAVDLESQAQAFWSQVGNEQFSEEVYLYWERVSKNGHMLQSLMTPLLIGVLSAVFAILAVLARLWELRPQRGHELAEATTAES